MTEFHPQFHRRITLAEVASGLAEEMGTTIEAVKEMGRNAEAVSFRRRISLALKDPRLGVGHRNSDIGPIIGRSASAISDYTNPHQHVDKFTRDQVNLAVEGFIAHH